MKIIRQWEEALSSHRLPKAPAAGFFCWVHLCIYWLPPFSLFMCRCLGAESLLAVSLQCLNNL